MIITVKCILNSPDGPLEIDLLFQQECGIVFLGNPRDRSSCKGGTGPASGLRAAAWKPLTLAGPATGGVGWKAPDSLGFGMPWLSGIPLPSEDTAHTEERGSGQVAGWRKNHPDRRDKPGEPLSGEPWPELEISIILKECLATPHFFNLFIFSWRVIAL